MKLSFIVPIYGVECYLRKCVDSLLHQDHEDYEIILVDDGGKDGCPAICDEYAAHYDNIRVIHRENGGLSVARNSGIDVARGEYICFVDSDDYWEENVLAELIAQIERDSLDVLRFDYRNVNEFGEMISPNKEPRRGADYSCRISSGGAFLRDRLGCGCYAWQFIVRADIVSQEFFTEGIYLEDVDWTPRVLMRAKRVASTKKIVYNYLWRTGSITLSNNKEKKRKMLEDQLYIITRLEAWKSLPEIRKWAQRNQSIVIINYLSSVAQCFFDERAMWIDKVRKYKIKLLDGTKSPWGYYVKVLLYNINPRLLVLILRK